MILMFSLTVKPLHFFSWPRHTLYKDVICAVLHVFFFSFLTFMLWISVEVSSLFQSHFHGGMLPFEMLTVAN